jgi:hypothetical protein
VRLSRLKELDLGSFNTHFGLCLGGGLAVILAAVGLSKELGAWHWAVLVVGIVGILAGLLGLMLNAWRAWRPSAAIPAAPVLEVRQGTESRYRFQPPGRQQDHWFHHRIGLYNRGAVAAGNVHVRLENITSRPRDGQFRGNYPYLVPAVSNLDDLTTGHRINPADELLFEIAQSWTTEHDGGRRIVAGVDRTQDDIGHHWDIRLEFQIDEQWEMHYSVSADNVAPVQFRVVMTASGYDIRCELAGAAPA